VAVLEGPERRADSGAAPKGRSELRRPNLADARGRGAVAHVALLQRTIGNKATSRLLGRDATAGAVIVADGIVPRLGQMTHGEMVEALQARVTTVADEVLGRVGLHSDGCIYLSPAFGLYASRDADYLAEAIDRFAPGALAGGDARKAIEAVAAHARFAFEEFVQKGSFRGVPEEVREAVHGTTTEPPAIAPPSQSNAISTEVGGQALQRCCWPWGQGRQQRYARIETELDVVSRLPAWDDATFVGYHAASVENWRQIRQSGEFRPGDGLYGNGIYVVEDPRLLSVYGNTDRVLLEVGYVGLPDNLTVEANANRNALPKERTIDVAEGGVPIRQKCYWLGGPSQLAQGNFRVRRAPPDLS
jgi:hypothetical protein